MPPEHKVKACHLITVSHTINTERKKKKAGLTCAQPLEVLIISPLSRRHDEGALIFEGSPMQGNTVRYYALNHVICWQHRRWIWIRAVSSKSFHAQNVIGTKWQLVVRRRFYCVIPSEYRTKEITSALLCLITDQGGEIPGNRSDRIGSEGTQMKAAFISDTRWFHKRSTWWRCGIDLVIWL